MGKKESENRVNHFVNIIITQAICLVIILLCVMSLKMISKPEYAKLKSFYEKEICADTAVAEVLE